ncbi:hypothetical protein WA026_012964, partial [Henosepilachna vigintioctopunctata]
SLDGGIFAWLSSRRGGVKVAASRSLRFPHGRPEQSNCCLPVVLMTLFSLVNAPVVSEACYEYNFYKM